MREAHDSIRGRLADGFTESGGPVVVPAALAFAGREDALFATVPVAALDRVDVEALLAGRFLFDQVPVMRWWLGGSGFAASGAPLGEGFYTVVADQRSGRVHLHDAAGNTVAGGELEICIEPEPMPPGGSVAAKATVSGGVDKFDVNLKKHHIEVCGHAEVSVLGASAKVEGCVSIDW
jgi:hypothetical protein